MCNRELLVAVEGGLLLIAELLSLLLFDEVVVCKCSMDLLLDKLFMLLTDGLRVNECELEEVNIISEAGVGLSPSRCDVSDFEASTVALLLDLRASANDVCSSFESFVKSKIFLLMVLFSIVRDSTTFVYHTIINIVKRICFKIMYRAMPISTHDKLF